MVVESRSAHSRMTGKAFHRVAVLGVAEDGGGDRNQARILLRRDAADLGQGFGTQQHDHDLHHQGIDESLRSGTRLAQFVEHHVEQRDERMFGVHDDRVIELVEQRTIAAAAKHQLGAAENQVGLAGGGAEPDQAVLERAGGAHVELPLDRAGAAQALRMSLGHDRDRAADKRQSLAAAIQKAFAPEHEMDQRLFRRLDVEPVMPAQLADRERLDANADVVEKPIDRFS